MTESDRPFGPDPTEIWSRWYEAGTRMWSDLLQGGSERYVDPWGLYRQWFESVERMRERPAERNGVGRSGSDELQEAWSRWVEAAIDSWQRSAQFGMDVAGLMPRWLKALRQAQENLLRVEDPPRDPMQFMAQWYNATSGPLAEFVQDVIEREEFLEPASQYLRSYAGLYRLFRRNAEEYLRTMQLPTRSDISRVASLVVALEEKVDRIEETFEDFEYRSAKPATEERVALLEERLGRVEEKLDRLLREVGERPAETAVRATEAARREAAERGVDLSGVEGTGEGGRITVEDVRRKGES
ncbi:hypothetical protein Rxycam_03067 [Rubrobacter xylanophilus DSM 9941]|uniref:E3 binding domain-containing protein n=1 Tax=Rubrobacter xylanophilus TaxID=49319 RepID=UPI001F309BD4|nr:E3 binding domain-containing protein [Rubrobacter xylanophilus]QYJ17225.1 hypothetical protein Rxycam_03067 [Rubrobacter xylanophilus DSM 9941]